MRPGAASGRQAVQLLARHGDIVTAPSQPLVEKLRVPSFPHVELLPAETTACQAVLERRKHTRPKKDCVDALPLRLF